MAMGHAKGSRDAVLAKKQGNSFSMGRGKGYALRAKKRDNEARHLSDWGTVRAKLARTSKSKRGPRQPYDIYLGPVDPAWKAMQRFCNPALPPTTSDAKLNEGVLKFLLIETIQNKLSENARPRQPVDIHNKSEPYDIYLGPVGSCVEGFFVIPGCP